jgi:hypothetical protein
MKLFFISWAGLSALFLSLDFMAARSKARNAAKTGEQPGGTSVLSGLVVAFVLALAVTLAARFL